MNKWEETVIEHTAKYRYLEDKREKNLETLNKRVVEIQKNKTVKKDKDRFAS